MRMGTKTVISWPLIFMMISSWELVIFFPKEHRVLTHARILDKFCLRWSG